MFKFVLPKFAALHVELPTGGSTLMVHIGDGVFVSKVPPIVLRGVSPEQSQQVEGIPVEWDGVSLPGDGEAHPCVFAFDMKSAGEAVDAAASAGDTYARKVLAEMEHAARTIAAQERLGLGSLSLSAQPANDPVDPSAEDVNEARAPVGLGPVDEAAAAPVVADAATPDAGQVAAAE